MGAENHHIIIQIMGTGGRACKKGERGPVNLFFLGVISRFRDNGERRTAAQQRQAQCQCHSVQWHSVRSKRACGQTSVWYNTLPASGGSVIASVSVRFVTVGLDSSLASADVINMYELISKRSLMSFLSIIIVELFKLGPQIPNKKMQDFFFNYTLVVSYSTGVFLNCFARHDLYFCPP